MGRRFLYSFVATLIVAQSAVVVYLAQDHVRNPPATVSVGESRDLSPELAALARRLADLESFKTDLDGLRDAIATLSDRGSFDPASLLRRLSALEARVGLDRRSPEPGLSDSIARLERCVNDLISKYNYHTHQQNEPGQYTYSQPSTDRPSLNNQKFSCY